MFECLIDLDKTFFLWLNSWRSPFFDQFYYIFTQKQTWIPLYVAMAAVIVATKRRESLWIVLAIAVVITLADQTASGIFKPLVERLRPSRDPSLEGLVNLVNGYRAGGYSFMSSHAANSFGIALFTSLLFRNRLFTCLIFAWAGLNAYSRIYLGVHFPLDIICGALVGLGAAWLCFALLRRFRPVAVRKMQHIRAYEQKYYTPPRKFSAKAVNIVSATLLLTVLLIAVFHNFLFKMLT